MPDGHEGTITHARVLRCDLLSAYNRTLKLQHTFRGTQGGFVRDTNVRDPLCWTPLPARAIPSGVRSIRQQSRIATEYPYSTSWCACRRGNAATPPYQARDRHYGHIRLSLRPRQEMLGRAGEDRAGLRIPWRRNTLGMTQLGRFGR